MNKVFLIGRLAADPELKTSQEGKHYCHFAIAVQKPGKEKEVDWFDVVAFNKTAEFTAQYFGKGKPIVVEGSLSINAWEDKNGNKRKDFRIMASNVEFVPRSADEAPQSNSFAQGKNDDFVNVNEDDLPFN